MNTIQQKQHLLPHVLPDRCMSAWGEDRFGIWSEVEIHGVVQRFRWIPPGEFMMGTSENEPGRRDSEVQHPVVLTIGYWLADTVCTQELWQAVMGDTPSHFKGTALPVERVSWADCKEFIDKVNKENPELKAALPTESQWEYACRADPTTNTPFSFGDNITPEQVNFGRKNRSTVDVKSLPANQWGLYEMHGNLWEWCADRYGDYPTDRVVDPHGPDTGGSRVLRGGSWSSSGWYCRSADRIYGEPGYRGLDIGFRLSRGHVEQA